MYLFKNRNFPGSHTETLPLNLPSIRLCPQASIHHLPADISTRSETEQKSKWNSAEKQRGVLFIAVNIGHRVNTSKHKDGNYVHADSVQGKQTVCSSLITKENSNFKPPKHQEHNSYHFSQFHCKKLSVFHLTATEQYSVMVAINKPLWQRMHLL